MNIKNTVNTGKWLMIFTSVLAAMVLLISAIGCVRPVPTPTPGDTVRFVDSVGRTVEIPRNIERIAPSGTLAQIILYTLCPDKLVGLTNSFSASQLEYIPSKYASLPTLGDFFGNTLNLEALMVANPQVIIDIGDPNVSGNMVGDLDDLQERTGIPVIFVEMDLATMVKAYRTLGEVTGEVEHAQKLTAYIEQTLSETEQKAKLIPNAERVTVYYCQGDGLAAIAQGTFHSDVIDIVGGVNVTVLSSSIVAGNGTST
ncbi:MAG: ABC transporter substrate-binding protein, partial [Dehalococcoidia bacterium]|nr:ABC transporter substrate-binding protein [Dehalococcoidia bacterium]